MTLEELIVGFVRVVSALPVLRWVFVGAIFAVIVDFSDLFMMNLLQFGGIRHYQAFDKWADLAYMVTFLVAALRWHGPVKNIAIGLFIFRFIGVGTFEMLNWRWLLLAFPNVFEFWVIFVAGISLIKPQHQLTQRQAIVVLVILFMFKELQEYVLHGARWLDEYRAVDVVMDWWVQLKILF